MTNLSKLHRSALAIIVCLGTLAGCGPDGPEIATVEGTVTMDGKPLANAAVVFNPPNGRPAGARTDSQGHYELTYTAGRSGAIPGKNKVRISTQSDPALDADGQLTAASPETVPAKYNAQTELEFDVKSGEANVADFDLSSEGELPASDDDEEDEDE